MLDMWSSFGAVNDQVLRVLGERGYQGSTPSIPFLLSGTDETICGIVVTWDFDSGDSLGVSAADSVIAYKKLADSRPKNSMALNHDTLDGTARTIVPQVCPPPSISLCPLSRDFGFGLG